MTSQVPKIIQAIEQRDLTLLEQVVAAKRFSKADLYKAFEKCLVDLSSGYREQRKYINFLLSVLTDANYLPDGEWNPLINCAIECSGDAEDGFDAKILQELINRGANPNDSRFWLPVMHAVDIECLGAQVQDIEEARPDTKMIRLLLENGADPFLADAQGRNAFDIAQSYGYAEIITILETYKSLQGESHGL